MNILLSGMLYQVAFKIGRGLTPPLPIGPEVRRRGGLNALPNNLILNATWSEHALRWATPKPDELLKKQGCGFQTSPNTPLHKDF